MSHDSPPSYFGNFSDFTHLSEDAKVHCVITVSLCAVSALVALLVGYVYFFHRGYSLRLRSHFNNLVIGCLAVQLVQALFRLGSASSLLRLSMSEGGCRILGALDAGMDTASVVLILGFYYSLLSLRFNPIKRVVLRIVSPSAYAVFRRYAWFVVALAIGTATAVSVVFETEEVGYFFGWCTPFGTPWIMFGTLFLPLVLMVATSIATMIALRCCINPDGSSGIVQPLTWKRHWSIYVRFFCIIIVVFATFLSSIVTHFALSRDKRQESRGVLPTVLQCMWPIVLGVTFLLTEGVFHFWARRCCGDSEQRHAVSASEKSSMLRLGDESVAVGDYRGGEQRQSEVRASTASSASPGASARQSLTASFAVQHPSDLNGFTSAIQSLLVMEVRGVQYIASGRHAMHESDALLLGSGAPVGGCSVSPSYAARGYDGWSDGTYSEAGPSPGGGERFMLDKALYGAGSPIVRGPAGSAANRFVSDLSDRPDVV